MKVIEREREREICLIFNYVYNVLGYYFECKFGSMVDFL